MERGDGAAATEAVATSSGGDFYLRLFVGFLRERHCLSGDGPIRSEHHTSDATLSVALLAGGGNGVEYWQRSDDYRQSAKHADWIIFRDQLSRFSFSSGPDRGDWTGHRLGDPSLDAHAQCGATRGDGRCHPAARPRSVTLDQTLDCRDRSGDWIFRGRASGHDGRLRCRGPADYADDRTAETLPGS